MQFILSFFNKKTTKFGLAMLLLSLAKLAYGAGPVVHALLGEKWIQHREHYNPQDAATFIRGTLFPDIRYLGVISRKETHIENVSLKDLKEEKDAFVKGKKLHSFVDEERERMVVQWNIYQKLKDVPGQKYISTFLKLLEDQILHTKSNWKEVKETLKLVDRNEKSYKISDEDLIKWHQMLDKSFTQAPVKQLETLAKRDKYLFDVPPKVVRRWSKILPELAKDPDLQAYVSNLMAHFDGLFKNNLTGNR